MPDNAKTQQEQEQEQEAAKRPYVFNKETGIVGYTFADGRKFRLGPTYPLTEEEAKEYAALKVDGHNLLVVKKG